MWVWPSSLRCRRRSHSAFFAATFRFVTLAGGGGVPVRLSGSIPLVLPLPCSMWASVVAPPPPPPELTMTDDDPGDDGEADDPGPDVGEHQPPLARFRARRLPLFAHFAQSLPLFLPAISHDRSAAV